METRSTSEQGLPGGRVWSWLYSLVLLELLFQASGVSGLEVSPERYPVKVSGYTLTLPYSTTHPIDVRNENIELAVIVHHGANPDAPWHFRAMQDAVALVPGLGERTIVIAPQFLTQDYLEASGVGNDVLYWTWSHEAFGALSAGPAAVFPRPAQVGSYEVLNSMLENLCDPSVFPSMKTIVIAGHSLGGQFANHYAAVNTFEQTVAEPRGIHMRYVVMNNAWHLYFSDERAVDLNPDIFAPLAPGECPLYNSYLWGLGLEDLYPHLGVSAAEILEQYPSRDVRYLYGLKDIEPWKTDKCVILVQGRNTLEGGIIYFSHLRHVFGEDIQSTQSIDLVPGVAHWTSWMFNSRQGLRALFKYDPSSQPILYVDDSAGKGGWGRSWEEAFRSLSDALRFAVAGQEVRVAAGTYTPSIPLDAEDARTACFSIPGGLTLVGGYAGLGSADPNERDTGQYVSVLNGDLLGDDSDLPASKQDNAYHVVRIEEGTELALLEGFTIERGNADNPDVYPHYRGGGLLISVGAGSPTIRDCHFRDNRGLEGGAVYARQCSPLFAGCRFTGNTALTWDGGAVYNRESSPTYRQCEFIDNHASDDGGASRNREGSTTLFESCLFTSNTAANNAGSIFSNDASRCDLHGCILLGNTATNSGGALCYDNSSTGSIENCLFSGNRALNYHGGAIRNSLDSSPTIGNCTFHCNSSGLWGGAIQNRDISRPIIINCVFWQNQDIGGIDESAQVDPIGSATIDHCCLQGWTGVSGGSGNFWADPLFVDALGIDDIAGTKDDDLHLRLRSPCVDAGRRINSIQIDFEGDPRGYDGTSEERGDGSDWDIGCDESQAREIPTGFLLCQRTIVEPRKR